MAERPQFAPWPAEVKSAIMTRDYREVSLQEQLLMDKKKEIESIEESWREILETFEAMGGTWGRTEFEDGTIEENQYTYEIGSTTVIVEFDEDMLPGNYVIYGNAKTDIHTVRAEKRIIFDVMKAQIYGECTGKAIDRLTAATEDLRSYKMIYGINDLAERVKEDSILVNNAIQGANIEKVDR